MIVYYCGYCTTVLVLVDEMCCTNHLFIHPSIIWILPFQRSANDVSSFVGDDVPVLLDAVVHIRGGNITCAS